jgi:hypothetical protein
MTGVSFDLLTAEGTLLFHPKSHVRRGLTGATQAPFP